MQQLEKGLLTNIEFYEIFRTTTQTTISDQQIKTAWNALLGNYRLSSLEFLTSLASNYHLYLLSNTNKIHYDSFVKTLKNTTPYSSLEDFFTKAYFSHDIHLRKPDKEIYEFVLQDADLIADETLFIDDTYTNLPEAVSIGIHTHLLTTGNKIEDIDFTKY